MIKWIVGLLIALAALAAGSYFGLSSHLKDDPAYRAAERFLASSEVLAQHVGGNVRFGRLPAATLTESQARYRIAVRGDSARTHALVELRVAGPDWIVSTASYETGDDVWESLDVQRQAGAGGAGRALVEEAKRLHQEGEWEAALERLDEALGEDDADGAAWYWKARIHVERGETGIAATEFENAVAADPDFKDAYVRLTHILESREDWDGSVAWWGLYLRRHPNDGEAHHARAQAYRSLGDFDAAMADDERGCELGHASSCRRLPEPAPQDEQAEEEIVEEEPADEYVLEDEPRSEEIP